MRICVLVLVQVFKLEILIVDSIHGSKREPSIFRVPSKVNEHL